MNTDIQKNFQSAKKLITESERILLTMHERMDGDDGGSVLALMHVLESEEKKVTVAIKQGVPPHLQFLPKSFKIVDDIYPVKPDEASSLKTKFNRADSQNFDLLITCGCGNKERTGSQSITNLRVPTINIDHHPDNSNFGDVNIVDSFKSSVAELVYDFFIFNNWKITKDIATCLLTGIITDTGSFKHANTKAKTLKTAGELMRKGANITKIINNTYKNKDPHILRAWGKAMENSFYDDKSKMIYAVVTEEDLKQLETLPEAAFEGFVETLNTAPEAKFAMFIRQDGNVIKGSLRSEAYKQIDVSKIARLFGGGGHKLAAGFSVVGKLKKNPQDHWEIV